MFQHSTILFVIFIHFPIRFINASEAEGTQRDERNTLLEEIEGKREMKVPMEKSRVKFDFFGAPYFKDPDYNSAPDNDDTKMLARDFRLSGNLAITLFKKPCKFIPLKTCPSPSFKYVVPNYCVKLVFQYPTTSCRNSKAR